MYLATPDFGLLVIGLRLAGDVFWMLFGVADSSRVVALAFLTLVVFWFVLMKQSRF